MKGYVGDGRRSLEEGVEGLESAHRERSNPGVRPPLRAARLQSPAVREIRKPTGSQSSLGHQMKGLIHFKSRTTRKHTTVCKLGDVKTGLVHRHGL